jgi:hypothetical protein
MVFLILTISSRKEVEIFQATSIVFREEKTREIRPRVAADTTTVDFLLMDHTHEEAAPFLCPPPHYTSKPL